MVLAQLADEADADPVSGKPVSQFVIALEIERDT
jgi:hypothetical protein